MKTTFMRITTVSLAVLVITFMCHLSSGYADTTIAGQWKLNANNYRGKMEISGAHGSYQGRFKFDNSSIWEEMRELHVSGNSITFLRNTAKQRYTGTIQGDHISGSFTQGGIGNYRWMAEKTDANPPAAQVLSLAGTWRLNANNFRGKMEISGDPGSYQGRFKFDNSAIWEEMRELQVNGNSISFLRAIAKQRYSGTVHGTSISGSFTQGGSGNYRWMADKK